MSFYQKATRNFADSIPIGSRLLRVSVSGGCVSTSLGTALGKMRELLKIIKKEWESKPEQASSSSSSHQSDGPGNVFPAVVTGAVQRSQL